MLLPHQHYLIPSYTMNMNVRSLAGVNHTRTAYLHNLLSAHELAEYHEMVSPDHTPIWAHWNEFIERSLLLGKSPQTLKSTRDTLKYLIRHTGIVSVEELNTPNELDRQLFRLQAERGFSLNSRRSYIKNLNTYFIWLYRNHHITENNIARIERGRERQKEIPPLKQSEVDRVIVHVSTRNHSCSLERARNKLVINILRFSGIRPCELLDLTTDAIYRENGKWVLAVSGRKQHARVRYYECPKFIIDSFNRYMQVRTEYQRWETPLFVSMSNKEGWTTSGLQNFFKKISKELGFRVNAYGFRRFVATQMNHNGVARDDMSRFLGHTRFTTTDRYIERSCALTANATSVMANVCAN